MWCCDKILVHFKKIHPFDIFLTFIIPLFYMVKWSQHLRVGFTRLLIVVLVSWLIEGTNLLLLVIFFIILGSSTSSCSCGTFRICLFDILAGHLLSDGPFFVFPSFVPNFFMHLFNIAYCNKVLTTTPWEIWTYTPRHECARHSLEFFPTLFLHLLQLGSSILIE